MSCEMRNIIFIVPESTLHADDGHHAGMARMGGRQTAREHHFLASQALLRARESTLHLCIRNQNALEREIAAKNSCKERAQMICQLPAVNTLSNEMVYGEHAVIGNGLSAVQQEGKTP